MRQSVRQPVTCWQQHICNPLLVTPLHHPKLTKSTHTYVHSFIRGPKMMTRQDLKTIHAITSSSTVRTCGRQHVHGEDQEPVKGVHVGRRRQDEALF